MEVRSGLGVDLLNSVISTGFRVGGVKYKLHEPQSTPPQTNMEPEMEPLVGNGVRQGPVVVSGWTPQV